LKTPAIPALIRSTLVSASTDGAAQATSGVPRTAAARTDRNQTKMSVFTARKCFMSQMENG
jgi:hypothetical protein